jgi:hypothetical protein
VKTPEPTWVEALLHSLHRPIDMQDRARAAMFCVNVLGNAMAGLSRTAEARPSGAERMPKLGGDSHNTLQPRPVHQEHAQDWLRLIAALDLDDIDHVSQMRPSATVFATAFALTPTRQLGSRAFLDAIIWGYETGLTVARQLVAATVPTEIVMRNAHAAASLTTGLCVQGQGAQMFTGHLRSMLSQMAAGTTPADLAQASTPSYDAGTQPWRTGRLLPQADGLTFGVGQARQLASESAQDARSPAAASARSTKPRDWLIHDASVRPWRVQSHVQPVLDAGLRLGRPPFALADIAELGLILPPGHLLIGDIPAPTDQQQISASLQTALAFVVLRGEPEPGRYLERAATDPEVSELASRVALIVSRPDEAARVTLILASGQKFEQMLKPAWGSPDNPLTAPELIARAQRLAVDVGGIAPQQASKLIQAAVSLMQETPLDRLFAAINDVRAGID